MTLDEWELRFDFALREIPESTRARAGAVLAVIPSRDEWEQFVGDVRREWWHWEWVFTLNPACLVVLYDGAAFYDYRSGAFWKGFAELLDVLEIPVNAQSDINHRYASAAQRFRLLVTPGNFVGSAVAHIGIPISMWDGFLHVCEWAMWTEAWDGFANDAWEEAMTRRLGGQTRLINFLVDNRDTATQFVREMLDACNVLSSDRSLTLKQTAELTFLRQEYFDEVPETADFLRPGAPESLFADRGCLAWNEERQTISIHLPPVRRESLPAIWRLGDLEQSAAGVALDFPINGGAFTKILRLQFTANDGETLQRIAGIDEWALYDEARLRFVHRGRDTLPISQYTLISQRPLDPKLDGWHHDSEDPRIDLEGQLADGTPIFLTQLCAVTRRPRLKIGDGGWIHFSQRRGVALRIFFGTNQASAARFSLTADRSIRTELWPRPFLEVPLSLVRDDDIPSEFTVFLDGQPARGKWVTFQYDPPGSNEDDAERAFCFWRWDEIPLPPPPQPATVHRTLAALDMGSLQPAQPSWCGRHSLYVQSRRLGRLMFGSVPDCHFDLLDSTAANLWPAAWDDYMAWVLLSQVQDDATWEEVRIARDAVAMFANINLNAVYYQIRKLERHGYLVARGHRYRDFHSRIVLANTPSGWFRGEYCGLTSLLYELVRKVSPRSLVVAPREPTRPAKLQIDWSQRERQTVRDACQNLGIETAQKLW